MRLDGRDVGEAGRVLVVAEAGVNHNGEVGLAHRLVDAAAAAGADAVKFQLFDAAALVSATASTAGYQEQATGLRSQRELLEDLALPDEAWPELRAHAADAGLLFLASPFDLPSAERLVALGLPALKVASGELTNLPFLQSLASLGLPLLVSTGMADEQEVAAAVEVTMAAPAVALFHCVSAYPAPADAANLRAIPGMRRRFAVPIGWSDHTEGHLTAVAAVALGAALVEKHITMDRGQPGPDHRASADPAGFAEYVTAIRTVEEALGDGVKRSQPVEEDVRVAARRSWHTVRDLAGGHVLDESDVVLVRPAVGLEPSRPLAGRRLARDVDAGAPVTADDLVPAEQGD